VKPGLEDYESRQAILLMYLAEELPEADRVEVDRRIAEDASVRIELEALRQMQASIWAGLGDLDRQSRPPVPDSVVNRRVGRLIKDWLKARSEIPAPIPMPRRQMHWIRYGVAVAAMLLIGFFLWPRERSLTEASRPLSITQPDDSTMADNTNTDDATAPADASQNDQVALLSESFGADSAFGDASTGERLAALTDTTNDPTNNQ
jgi:hypothetical protein